MTVVLFPTVSPPLSPDLGLRRPRGEILELPPPLTLDADPIHIIHSDMTQLAVLAGLAALQSWAIGLDAGGPPVQRRPIVIATERPAAVAAAYLELRLSRAMLGPLARTRRLSFYNRGLPVPETRGTLWDIVLEGIGPDLRLHNLFPAALLFQLGCEARLVGPREYLGRGDTEGPAILLVRPFEEELLADVCATRAPSFAFVDAPSALRPPRLPIPTLVFHDSVFANGVVRAGVLNQALVLLPDQQLQHFCELSVVHIVEPPVPASFSRSWDRLDGAVQLLLDRSEDRGHPIIREVLRSALRLREILLQLPLGLAAYEQCLVLSDLSETLWDSWSATRLLQTLENRRAEMAALGEWEEMLISELVDSFRDVCGTLENASPKTEAVLAAVASSDRIALIATSRVVGAALNAAIHLPRPLGFGLVSPKGARAISQDELRSLDAGEHCIVHHAFEPSRLLGGLVRGGPRTMTFVLLPNELRFLTRRFKGVRGAIRESPAVNRLLEPLFEHLDRLQPAPGSLTRVDVSSTIARGDFEKFQRLFERGLPRMRLGTVLLSSLDPVSQGLQARVEAVVIQLDGGRGVLLEEKSRVAVVGPGDSIRRKEPADLELGDRLIVIDSEAREAIVHPVLTARTEQEVRDGLMAPITRWQEELRAGRERAELTYERILEQLRASGSRLTDPAAIGSWARGDVNGPLDPRDVFRVGQILESTWLISHWGEVGVALLLMRTGHRLLGRQMTRLIERAAVGDTEVSAEDRVFLDRLGITMATLQDAVELLTVEAVGKETHSVAFDRVGQVFLASEGESSDDS